jgi:hypothetical protein
MSGIDQRALDAASKALANIHQYNGPNEETDADAKRVIEAYLAAKPSPWRPIEEAPRDGTPILVWTPRFDGPFGECDDRTEILRFERSPAGPEVYWYAFSGRALTDQGMIDIKARWKNIDPPDSEEVIRTRWSKPPDGDCSPESTPPAAEED